VKFKGDSGIRHFRSQIKVTFKKIIILRFVKLKQYTVYVNIFIHIKPLICGKFKAKLPSKKIYIFTYNHAQQSAKS